MESTSSNPQKGQKATIPPRRGQIKAQIFGSLAEAVSSKAKEVLSKLRGSADDGGPSRASTTPPPSAYTSDGSPNNA